MSQKSNHNSTGYKANVVNKSFDDIDTPVAFDFNSVNIQIDIYVKVSIISQVKILRVHVTETAKKGEKRLRNQLSHLTSKLCNTKFIYLLSQ